MDTLTDEDLTREGWRHTENGPYCGACLREIRHDAYRRKTELDWDNVRLLRAEDFSSGGNVECACCGEIEAGIELV